MLWLRRWVSFGLLSGCKIGSTLFYRLRHRRVGDLEPDWDRVKLVIFLHHTSLLETLYIQFLSFGFIRRLSRGCAIPGATKTLDRPLVGKFFRWLSPNMTPITRKRDETWDRFIEVLRNENPIVIIAPEGRMMRPNGLDSNGQPMTVKSGVVDVLSELSGGQILIAYSGGLHHIQKPGVSKIAIFRSIYLNTEILDLDDYKKGFPAEGFRDAVVHDLEERKAAHCPVEENRPLRYLV